MFATLTSPGSDAASTQTECRRSERSIRRTTISCSCRSLGERRSCSPRWSSTDGSALRLVEPASADGRRAGAASPHQELGARADEGAPPASRSRSRSRRESPRAGRRRAPPGSWARGASTTTSRASTTFSSSPALIRSTPRSTERSKRSGGAALAIRTSPVRSGSGSGSSASPRAPTRARSRADTAAGSVPGPTSAQSVRCVWPPARWSASSGITSRAGGNDDHCGPPPPSGAKAKPPTHTGPAPAGSPVGSRAHLLSRDPLAEADSVAKPLRCPARRPRRRSPAAARANPSDRAAPSRTSGLARGATRTPPRSGPPRRPAR